MTAPSGSFLRTHAYVDFLSETHPELELSRDRLPVPSYRTVVELKDGLRPGSWVQGAAGLFPLAPRALCVGVPFEPYDQTYLLDEIGDPMDFVRRCRSEVQRERAGLCFFPNVAADHPRVEELVGAGFHRVPSFPDMRVELDVEDFGQHLMRVPQGDRSGVRRNIKRFHRAGHRIEPLTGSETPHVLYRAYLTFQERALVPWVPHTEAYFEGLPGLDPAVRLQVARNEDDRIMGFVVNFWEEDYVQSGRIGVVPEYDRKDAVYFRLLYHALEDGFEAAQEGHRHHLSLEPTGYRTKRHLGAEQIPLVNLLLGVSPFWATTLLATPQARFFLRHLRDPKALESYY